MKKKALIEAAKKLRKMFPDVYTSVDFTAQFDMHPKSVPEYSQKCQIYIAGIGFSDGATFEECFAQL